MIIRTVNDENDWEFVKRLFLENKVAMFKTAQNVVRDYHMARDMVSESCLVMFKKIQYLRKIDASKRKAYIISIVQNNSLMYLRKCKRESRLWGESQHLLEEQNIRAQDMTSRLIVKAEMQMVHEALARIHKRDSELLKMKYFEKLPDAQIAEIMGIGTASVRFYLTKAKRNLEKELKRSREE